MSLKYPKIQCLAMCASAALLFACTSIAMAKDTLDKNVSTVVSSRIPSLVPSRVTQQIDDKKMATLKGHVRSFLSAATDRGAVEDAHPLGVVMLMLSRTPQQQADLDALVDQMHNKNHANYHKWLTPQEFGARFQPSDDDVASVKTWLETHGFKVLDVVPSKTSINFTGTVGQLREAFKADMHYVTIAGEKHIATMTEPQVPAALAPVVAGLQTLDDFSPKPLMKPFGAFKRDLKTGKVTPAEGTTFSPTAIGALSGNPGLTGSESGNTFYEVGPQDFYTIYNENPLLTAGITGAGQTIAVIEEVQVAPADVTSFRSLFGLPAYPATPNATQGGVNYLLGSASGLGGYASCLAPVSQSAGHTSGEESEADIDLQWAGTVAPNAIIDFVACGGTAGGDGSSPGAYGTDRAAQYIANYLYSTVVAASMSYGECEGDLTSTNMAYYNGQWQQYAAEGITAVISSGDGGAEQCYQNSKYATSLAPSVNGFGSSAYNVSAGGTDFGDAYLSNFYATTPATTWWNATNGTGQGSAVAYVPETTWAGYCSNQLYASRLQKNGSTTYGTTYTPEAICNNSAANTAGLRAVVGGAGGISTYNSIPTWQSVYGVGLNSVSATKRNLPDVSLFASNGWWGHFLPYCESDAYACTLADYTAGDMGAGGTSYVAPQLAGLMALVAQQTGSRQGQANYTFYNLAAQQYGTPGNPNANIAACSGSNVATGQAPPSSCIFYDISNDMASLQGGTITPGIYQPCRSTAANCYNGNGGGTYGVNTVPGTTTSAGILGYTASPGYDDATGLGSLNINALVTGWNSTSPSFASTTSLATSAGTVAPTGSVTLTATVVAKGRGGAVAPSGSVEFFVGSTSGTNLGTASITSTCSGTNTTTACTATASLAVAGSALPAGIDSIVAYFEGDGANDAPSTSAAQTVKVYGSPVGNLELAVDATTASTTVGTTDNLFVEGWAADLVDGAPVTSVAISIDGVPVTGGTLTNGISRSDVVSYTGNSAYLKSGFTFVYPASSLALGAHTVTAVATNLAEISTTLGSFPITVAVVYPAPVGNVEIVADASTGASTVYTADKIFVGGWIGDPTDGSPLGIINVYVDGAPANGTLTKSIARPDVATAYGTSYANAGFSFVTSASALAAGPHTVTVVGTNSHGVSTTLNAVTITVVNSGPIGGLDLAVDSGTGQPTVSKSTGTLFVEGWAADYHDNGPAKSVSILIDGTAVGAATLGQARPDVASYYSNPAWGLTGYTFGFSASGLSVGNHTVTALATDSLSLSTSLGPLTITVTP